MRVYELKIRCQILNRELGLILAAAPQEKQEYVGNFIQGTQPSRRRRQLKSLQTLLIWKKN